MQVHKFNDINFKLSRFFIVLFIMLSFITQSMGESGILYRITLPDIMGAIAIGFYILSRCRFALVQYWYISFFIIALFVSGLLGMDITTSMIEVLIHLFLFLLFIVMISHFGTSTDVLDLITYFAMAGILASVIGFYDMAAEITGLPRIFPARAAGEVLSAFRNAGQAGAYALVLLSVLIPVRCSEIFNFFSRKQQIIITISLCSTLLFLLATGKMGAYIGFAIGLSIFFLRKRNIKTFLVSLVSIIILFSAWYNLDDILPQTAERISHKYSTRMHYVVSGEIGLLDEDTFLGENIRLALDAFKDNPLTGTGIGAFGSYFHSYYYEVHSTYFKMLAEVGLLGCLAYILFMWKFLSNLKDMSRKTPWQDFMYYYLPFLLGCIVSWTYTYHMRKREFWIMAAVVTIICHIITIEKDRRSKKQIS